MAHEEKNTTASTGMDEKHYDQKVVAISPSLSTSVPLQSIRGRGLSKAERVRGVTKSLVVDALTVLDEMRDDCQKSPELQENYYQLYHCLSYLKRFCDGKV